MSPASAVTAPIAAAVITEQLVAQLGDRVTSDEADQLGQAAYGALISSGWQITAGLGAGLRRVSPILWEYDPAILAGLARGYTPAEIGQATGTPYATVRNRARRLRARIGARNAAHAVAIAYRSGWMHGLAPEPRSTVTLSTRQRQVLALMADGLNNDEIAGELCLGRDTATVHVRRIYNALDVTRPGSAPGSSRPHAVALAFQHGLLDLHTAQRHAA